VPLFQPWQDWLGWSFAVVVVVVIILGQTWLVRHAGKSHNHAREDLVDGHRHEADRGFRKRNRYLWLTAVTAVAITIGMIWRGTAALGNAGFGTTTVMIFAAAVTGLLPPTLAYLGFALDGSRISRERDGLAAQLDDDLDDYLKAISDSRRDLAGVAEIGETLRNKTFPDICHATQEAVDRVYRFYGTVRLLIGGLSADPPAKTTKTPPRSRRPPPITWYQVDPCRHALWSRNARTASPGGGLVIIGLPGSRVHLIRSWSAASARQGSSCSPFTPV
jgi:hypothetical protein